MVDLPALPKTVAEIIGDFFASPIKRDRIGSGHDIRSSSLRQVEAEALARLVLALRPERSLEIGLAEGGSCVAITAARSALGLEHKHLALDPYQEKLTAGAGLLELARLNLTRNMAWIEQRSENYLHHLVEAGGPSLDFVFVDGGHDIAQKLTDAFYVDRSLNPGGVVAFHDMLLFSTATAIRHLVQERAYVPVAMPKDNVVRSMARSLRYAIPLGRWYAMKIVPKSCRSLVALRKPIPRR